jgi:hypothetical protein
MTNLVVVRLTGGLGNQLFQYAAACGVADVSGGVVALDLSEFSDGEKTRSYVLDRYQLDIPTLIGTSFDPEFAAVTIPAQEGLARIGLTGDVRLPVYRENNYEFEPALKSWRESTYLYGFWQSWKYFDRIADTIRARLALSPRDGDGPKPSPRIDADTVAVHVRRNDYLTASPLTAFGICEPAYYDGAMALLRERITSPQFQIFSDDPEWCRQHFTDADVRVVSMSGGDARDDLAAMARCRHHIIANSSMSWWGAWLGTEPHSIVIAPMPWYSQSPRAHDLIPDHWIRLDRRSGANWPDQRSAVGRDLVSAVILARNGAAALRRAFASVKSQSYANLEIVIAIGNRDPDTLRAAEELCSQVDRGRIVQGSLASHALAAGAMAATGDWVAFLDDNDVWLSEKIEIEVEAAWLTDAEVVCSRTIPIMGAAGLPLNYPPPGRPDCSLQDLLAAGHFIAGISHTLARRAVFTAINDRVGPADESWIPGEENAVWPLLFWEHRLVMLWQRLVESPIPFLGRSRRRLEPVARLPMAGARS